MKESYFLICHTVGRITSATEDADPEAKWRAVTALSTQPGFRQKAASPLPSLLCCSHCHSQRPVLYRKA